MKRSFLVIFVLTIIIATVIPLFLTACIPVVEVTGENLIQNPGFEEPTNGCMGAPDNWTPTGTSLGRSTDDYSGNCSAYIYAGNSSYTQTLRIKGIALYRFGGYIKSSESTATLELTVLDSDGEQVESSIIWLAQYTSITLEGQVRVSTNETVWDKNRLYLGTPDTAYYAVIRLEMTPGEGASNPKAWFDDIVLELQSECFIATAAYGTSTAEQLDVLRAFRDQVLVESTLGSQFVARYYQVSPPLADFISENSLLGALVRELVIEPMVSIAKLTQGIWGD